MRFLGVDLAWKDGNATGVATLEGRAFPLRLAEAPRTLDDHRTVLHWIEREISGRRAAIAIEDRWDALLCALAVALEFLGPPGAMRLYPDAPGAWRSGAILAPALGTRRDAR